MLETEQNLILTGGLVERMETTGQHDVLIYNNLLEQLKGLTYEQEKHQSAHTEEMSQIENTKNKTDRKIAVLEDQFEEVQSQILQESFFILDQYILYFECILHCPSEDCNVVSNSILPGVSGFSD